MAIPRILPAVLGVTASIATTAVLATQIILARSDAQRASSVRITATVAAIFEAIVLAFLVVFVLSHAIQWTLVVRLRRFSNLWLSTGVVLCTVGAAVSVASLICLSRVVDDVNSTILGSKATDLMIGASTALGLAFAVQLVFFVVHALAARAQGVGMHLLGCSNRNDRPLPKVKSIPYHETVPASEKRKGRMSVEVWSPPGSSAGRSAGSIRSSLSQVVRPISSKTRLLSTSSRFSRRTASIDVPEVPPVYTPPSGCVEDGFDSWDTSSVDTENRKTVTEPSSSPVLSHVLEPIPASPITAQTHSSNSSTEKLEPPPRSARRRSRSYSPMPTSALIQAQRTSFTQHVSHSESHIHPLFRSNSPAPPTIATPGTMVVAAPNGGGVISDKASIRSIKSMRRLRSDSMPVVPSPLSRATSLDSFHRRMESNCSRETRETETVPEIDELRALAVPEVETESTMTPPIPDWIFNVGTRECGNAYRTEGPGSWQPGK